MFETIVCIFLLFVAIVFAITLDIIVLVIIYDFYHNSRYFLNWLNVNLHRKIKKCILEKIDHEKVGEK